MVGKFKSFVPEIADDCFVAANASVIGRVVLEDAASIWFGAVLRGDIEPVRIGRGTNVQDLSVAHTSDGFPVVIGSMTTIGHGVVLHGCCVGDGCLIGMGSILLDGCSIGDGSIIAAGALVKQGQEIPPCSLAVGSPARVVRRISDSEIAGIRENAERYMKLRGEYLRMDGV